MDGTKRQLLAKSILVELLPILNNVGLSEEDGCFAFAVKKNEVKGYDISIAMSFYSSFTPVSPFKYNLFDIGFELDFLQCDFNNDSQSYEWVSGEYQIKHPEHSRSIVWGYEAPGSYDPQLAVKGVKDIGLGDDKAIAKLIFNTLLDKLDKTTLLKFALEVFAAGEPTAGRPNTVN